MAAMTWTAPPFDVVDEPFAGEERAMLEGFLEHGRSALLHACAGLTGEQLARRATPPSTLSLLGLVRHATEVERTWFRRRFGGQDVGPPYARPDQPDAAFVEVDPAAAERDIERLVAEWDAARLAVAGLPLGHVFVSARWGEMTLRWGYVHMVSEYAQHRGHADLLRERIEGAGQDSA
jgi:uncharacterized damage-inducible protein DinB